MRKYAFRIFTIIGLIVLFLLIYKVADNDKTNEIYYGYLESVNKNVDVNFLVLGTDKDETRTDLILLCHYDGEKNLINALQIPRDTKVETARKDKKINSAYGSKKGIECVKSEIGSLTGIYPDKYIVLNFDGFRKLVDAIGGVEYTVPVNMKYSDPAQNLYIDLKQGRQVLDGKKAEMLMRFRKNDDGSGYVDGDIGRLKVQKNFYKEVVRKLLSFEAIMNIGGVMDAAQGNFKTDFTLNDFISHIKDFKKFNENSVNVFVLPGSGKYLEENGQKISYYIADANELNELTNLYFN